MMASIFSYAADSVLVDKCNSLSDKQSLTPGKF